MQAIDRLQLQCGSNSVCDTRGEKLGSFIRGPRDHMGREIHAGELGGIWTDVFLLHIFGEVMEYPACASAHVQDDGIA